MDRKVIGDIVHGAFSNERLKKILKHFGPIAFKRASVCMEFEHFLKQIEANGKCCLEIGSYNGISAVVLSQYFDKVVCVSIDNDGAIIRDEIVRYLGIKNIEFQDVGNNFQKKQIVKTLDFDFCYSDGDHESDAVTDFELVKRCGRVLLHEYWPLQPSVWNLVNSLPEHQVTRAQFDCLAYWHG